MERDIGFYWIKTEWTDGWEPARWDGSEVLNIGEEILGFPPSDVIEWGPRIYPPDHVFTDTAQPFDYDERLTEPVPDCSDYQA